MPGSTATLNFVDGQVNGGASCNSFGGEYTLGSGNSIEFGMLMSTMMACSQPQGVMEQEQAYLQALAEAKKFQVEGAEFTLYDDSGNALLRFNQVSAE